MRGLVTDHFGSYTQSKFRGTRRKGRYSAEKSSQLYWTGQYKKCVQYVIKFTSVYSVWSLMPQRPLNSQTFPNWSYSKQLAVIFCLGLLKRGCKFISSSNFLFMAIDRIRFYSQIVERKFSIHIRKAFNECYLKPNKLSLSKSTF